MDKLSKHLLELIDCNCNECKFMVRDIEKLNLHRKSYEGTGLMDALQFGNCSKFNNKPVSFIANTCQLEIQQCFEHRRTTEEVMKKQNPTS